MHYEIKTRYDILTGKCTIDVDKLSEGSINSELRELIDKTSSFETFVLPCGDAAADMREVVKSLRNRSTIIIEKFLKKLAEILLDRDISEKKLKNSTGLNIKLSKFTGHNSESDIYTFRSEFQKLREPNVQKCLWADYLKKFLGGAAHNLVSKEESTEDIWTKLLKVYGGTHLLFQNKISSLGQFSDFEKIKDDETKTYVISSLLNVMTDLVKLAEKYELEGELYFGGDLLRILNLIGRNRERKFIMPTASDERLKGKAKWEKLVEFLKIELKGCEACLLNGKIRQSWNSDVVGVVPETKQMSHAFVSRTPKALNSFEKLESTGINISYRCIGCRDVRHAKMGR